MTISPIVTILRPIAGSCACSSPLHSCRPDRAATAALGSRSRTPRNRIALWLVDARDACRTHFANAACPIAVLRAAGHPDRGDDAAALHHRADLLFRDARPVAWRGRCSAACRARHGRRVRSGHRLAVRSLAAGFGRRRGFFLLALAGRRHLLRHAVLAAGQTRRALSRLLGRGIVDGLHRQRSCPTRRGAPSSPATIASARASPASARPSRWSAR